MSSHPLLLYAGMGKSPVGDTSTPQTQGFQLHVCEFSPHEDVTQVEHSNQMPIDVPRVQSAVP